MANSGNALFLGTPEDADYIPYLKPYFKGWNTYVVIGKIELLAHLDLYCSRKGIQRVVSTSTEILCKLLALEGNVKTSASLENYAGSMFTYKNLEIVFINPLKQLQTVSYGKFITSRFISKILSPESWQESTAFQWEILTPDNIREHYHAFQNAYAIAADIETKKDPIRIDCISWTGVFFSGSSITTRTVVLELKTMYDVEWMRKFNALPAAKIFQNGKYDVSYLLRYNATPNNWLWDTKNLFHCWYSELPKDLAFLNAFFLRKVVYWKDLAESGDRKDYLRYNCLDSWATANVWIQQLLQMPEWARRNYLLEFPLVFPCLLAEMTGIRQDRERLLTARKEIDTKESAELTSLRRMIGVPAFNPGSHVQVKLLMCALGGKDIAASSSDEKHLMKLAYRHPLAARIVECVLNIRGLRKLATTYLRTDDDATKQNEWNGFKDFCGRILYALNPDGTDTCRLASREHHFWCGLQIQNIPRGVEVKQTLGAEDGFFLGECDLEQAESRDTAHIAGDNDLITAVSGTSDFHSVNCSAFFGVPYADIFDDSTGKTKNKALRDLAKRVNHGANYNMGPGVLVDTMGLKNIWSAAKMLGLKFIDPKKVAEYLLAQFHRTYPNIAGKYYVSITNEVGRSSKIVSRAYHHTAYNLSTKGAAEYISEGDWTRYCFGDPSSSKSDLNAYVAHAPQSLNARTLNEAFMRVFYDIAIPNPLHFRLQAQIHDSILFSYAAGFEYLADKVKECMEIPVTVRDVSGISRTFTVPAALKLGKKDKLTGEFVRARYWSETE